MTNHTPFFPALNARMGSWKRKLLPQPEKPFVHLLSVLFGPLIPGHWLLPEQKKDFSRRRLWPKERIFWTFLTQVLCPEDSCRCAVRQARALALLQDRPAPSDNTTAYCRARARFKLGWIQQLIDHVGRLLTQRIRPELRWLGHEVKIMDATTASLPDTPANQKVYPQSSSQKPGLGFPVMRVTALFCLASGALLNYATGGHGQSEFSMALSLLKGLRPGDVLLADRLYGCYRFLAHILLLKAHGVCRLHASRKVDFRKAKRLGKNDALFVWKRSQKPKDVTAAQWLALPEEITVRVVRYVITQPGFRSRKVSLVTTLLEPKAYPVRELARFYKLRWQVELSFAQIKTMLRMDRLSTLTPAMAQKELAMHLLAYQLIRAVMQESTLIWDARLDRISFQGTLDGVCQYGQAMAQAHSKRKRCALYADLLQKIAQDAVPERPNRREPRALKRRLKNFPRLTCHRKKFKEIPHESRILSRRAKARKNLCS